MQLALGITPIAASFMVVAPIAGRAIGRVGSERLATAGFVAAAGGAVLDGAGVAGSQSYGAVLPGLICFGCGLAASTAPDHRSRRSTTCPRPRLGVASALPNISRYIGGALGAALLGAILHAYLSTGLDRRPRPGRPRRGATSWPTAFARRSWWRPSSC